MSIKKRNSVYRELKETSDQLHQSYEDGLINTPELVELLDNALHTFRQDTIESFERDIEDFTFTVNKMQIR
jgi:hypothetical protein